MSLSRVGLEGVMDKDMGKPQTQEADEGLPRVGENVAFRAIVGRVSMINLLGACGLRAWSGENTTF